MADTPPPISTMPSPARCLIGALIAAAIAFGAYSLMNAIALSFASKPIHSTNITVVNITIAVRTLVVGIMALATGVTSLASLGLFGLGIQTLLGSLFGKSSDPSS
ncbi:DUF3082 domain-containing protein [Myxacorys almedinensis]|uniref:DUF3082 domain-containing protein n=1 Tax=Myxacorys almedinensis A TaxID=2690445 RepID=A0A8J7Z259_9CYAN|nr:DUF3082 domain-containing protein [Myxacorys almedinensis]NDJ18279.1 DUF3082 domain-containing protein [Myxacorys almedinensis A]